MPPAGPGRRGGAPSRLASMAAPGRREPGPGSGALGAAQPSMTGIDAVRGHGAWIEVVGVATGKYSVEELTEAGADWALETVEAGFPV